MKRRVSRSPHQAFTLLELIAALAVLSLMIGGVFAIASSALQLSEQSQLHRLQEIRLAKLAQIFRTGLANLPPGHEIEMRGDGSLAVRHPGQSFHRPGLSAMGNQVIIRFNSGAIEMAHFLGDAELGSFKLMEGLKEALWEIYDPQTDDWKKNGKRNGETPGTLLRLRYATNAGGYCDEVFWIPTLTGSPDSP